jgi:lantibiotic modifying enzyme
MAPSGCSSCRQAGEMPLSESEIIAIVRRATDGEEPSAALSWAGEMRRMLNALVDLEFRPGRASPLVKLCEAGARYGWRSLETAINPKFLAILSPKARASLARDLRRSLEQLTRPCLELERTSFGLALDSMGITGGPPNPNLTDRMFLRDKPSHRLFALFKEFPALARLWSQLISQWCDQVTEVLSRFAADRRALAHAFPGSQPTGTIVNIRSSLSDSHNHGRTVMELQFEAGAVIYKPRPGDGEWEWGSLLEWMNAQSFQPRFRVGRVLRRKGYCWMERIEVRLCKTRAEARRFYERIGGLIAGAYLLRAVDCHRDNLLASGEDPVLVDADALWHVSPAPKTQNPFDLLSRTGFFPDSNPRSLQSRSSVLRRTNRGGEAARIGARPLSAVQYEREIVRGFRRAWHCILGAQERRRVFTRRVRRIQSRKRRWICRATEKYAAIQRASIQPGALRSAAERQLLITRLSRRNTVDPEVVEAEIDALARLDIPYFLRSRKEPLFPERGNLPKDVCEALRQLLA